MYGSRLVGLVLQFPHHSFDVVKIMLEIVPYVYAPCLKERPKHLSALALVKL